MSNLYIAAATHLSDCLQQNERLEYVFIYGTYISNNLIARAPLFPTSIIQSTRLERDQGIQLQFAMNFRFLALPLIPFFLSHSHSVLPLSQLTSMRIPMLATLDSLR